MRRWTLRLTTVPPNLETESENWPANDSGKANLCSSFKRSTEKRNDLVHSVWGKELDGEPARKGSGHEWRPLPTTTELHDLAENLAGLTSQLNEARLEGFLHVALTQKVK